MRAVYHNTGKGFGVVIAAAGKTAALSGVVSAYTSLPVLGVPLEAGMLAVLMQYPALNNPTVAE